MTIFIFTLFLLINPAVPLADDDGQQMEYATTGGICGTAAAVFAASVVVCIIILKTKCRKNRNAENSSDKSYERKLSNGVDVVATNIVNCEQNERTVRRRELNEATAPTAKDLPLSVFHAVLSTERRIPVINYNRLKFVSNLGDGNFAIVDKKKLQNSRTGYYLFVADKYAKDHEKSFYEILLKEKAIMARMPLHVNVLKLLAVTTDDEVHLTEDKQRLGKEHLILEYCDHKSLYDTIRKSSTSDDSSLSDAIDTDDVGLTRYHLYYIAYQIIDGMNFLSKHNLVHRDLALRNVLLADELVVKISDFGLTKEAATEYCAKSGIQLPHEIAPEIIQKKLKQLSPVFTTKSDVYSLGILLWLLFDLSVSDSVSKNLLSNAANGVTIRKPRYACDKIYALIQSCLKIDPESRPDFEECLNQIVSACNAQSATLVEQIKENVLKYGYRRHVEKGWHCHVNRMENTGVRTGVYEAQTSSVRGTKVGRMKRWRDVIIAVVGRMGQSMETTFKRLCPKRSTSKTFVNGSVKAYGDD